jgi:polar amino acid transport system ATP-binding protein
VIRAEGIAKRLGGRPVLAGLDLEIARGEIVCIVGPSGSGKSTLLRCLGGLERIDEGRIAIDGTAVGASDGPGALAALRRRAGMVFQDLHLFPHKTALENVALAPRVVLGEERREAEERARALLARVGLEGFELRYPASLSGGQRQRVAIARALAMRPLALLYDEPTSALDPNLVGDVVSLLASLKEEGFTQVVVTHELRFAREVADRVGHLQWGRIVQLGSPESVLEKAFGEAASARRARRRR